MLILGAGCIRAYENINIFKFQITSSYVHISIDEFPFPPQDGKISRGVVKRLEQKVLLIYVKWWPDLLGYGKKYFLEDICPILYLDLFGR